MIMTTNRVHTVTRQAVSLPQRNMVEGEIGMTKNCMMSSAAEMHTAGLKTGIRSVNILNRSSVKKETMTTMAPITTNLTDSVLPKEGIIQEESRHSPKT
jgi:hypothetical protein